MREPAARLFLTCLLLRVQTSLSVSRQDLLASSIPVMSGPASDSILYSATDSRTLLESALDGFESFQSIKQLQSGFAERIGFRTELFRVLDREPDSIDSYAGLVCHLEFNR